MGWVWVLNKFAFQSVPQTLMTSDTVMVELWHSGNTLPVRVSSSSIEEEATKLSMKNGLGLDRMTLKYGCLCRGKPKSCLTGMVTSMRNARPSRKEVEEALVSCYTQAFLSPWVK